MINLYLHQLKKALKNIFASKECHSYRTVPPEDKSWDITCTDSSQSEDSPQKQTFCESVKRWGVAGHPLLCWHSRERMAKRSSSFPPSEQKRLWTGNLSACKSNFTPCKADGSGGGVTALPAQGSLCPSCLQWPNASQDTPLCSPKSSYYVLHIPPLHWVDKYLALSPSGGQKLNSM